LGAVILKPLLLLPTQKQNISAFAEVELMALNVNAITKIVNVYLMYVAIKISSFD